MTSRALEVVTVQATAPGATLTAFAAVTGNSLTVRDAKKARLLATWSKRQGAGGLRITSPSLHDNTIGIQHHLNLADQAVDMYDTPQMLMGQDVLTVQGSGSATAGDIEQSSLLVAYDDLPGVSGNFISPQQLKSRAVNKYSNIIVISAGTSGGYSGSVAVNSAQDAFKANTDYALLGISTAIAACCTVRVVGPDWGNLGIGVPGVLEDNDVECDRWFVRLSEVVGLPLIPVMNSANKGLTLVDVAQDENGIDPTICLHWVELK